MQIHVNKLALTPGCTRVGETIDSPAAGGGVVIDVQDWNCARWLNMTMTVQEDHAMAYNLLIYGAEEAPRMTIRFGLMPHFPAAVAIDLNWLDGHILFPGHRVGTQKVVCHGARIRREEIRRVELVTLASHHPVKTALMSLALEDAPAEPLPLPETKLIDEMGQYIPGEWPGKLHSTDELCAKLRATAAADDAYPFHATKWGGCADRKLKEGTGWFSTAKRDGRWYICDPEGCAFFSMGPDGVVIRCDGRVDGLEPLLTELPDEACCEVTPRFGEVERTDPLLVGFERYNLRCAFGEDWHIAWQQIITTQLKTHGMNTIANWSDPSLYGRMPYVTMLPQFPTTAHCIFRDFPDVFAPEFEQNAAKEAAWLAQWRDDPMMIGYFLRNEPMWAFVDGLIIADEVLRDPADTASKAALIDWLRDKYGSVDALNTAWSSGFDSFAALRTPREKTSALSETARADLTAFSRRMIERYVTIPAAACRAVDPHHMNLGMRWAWISDPAVISGWQCFDVFSVNCYAIDPTRMLDQVVSLGVDKPIMIGEFHFGALDAGLPATGLEGVLTQRDRGVAFRYYAERVAAHPYGAGCHYFQCYDQFALGRFDGENYNIGLFDVCLQPYADMMNAVRACAEGIYAVNAGEKPPVGEKPETIPMIAY